MLEVSLGISIVGRLQWPAAECFCNEQERKPAGGDAPTLQLLMSRVGNTYRIEY